MEIETYLTSGDESLRLYRSVVQQIRRQAWRIRVRHAVFVYGYLLLATAGLVGVNIFAHFMTTRLVMAFLLILIAQKFRTSGVADIDGRLIMPAVCRVLFPYSRQNAYEILQRARADESPYGKAIINAIEGVVRMASGGYATVTAGITVSCVHDQSHVWGMVLDFPLYGQLDYVVYCPTCGKLVKVTLDGSRVPESLIPLQMRDDIQALYAAGLFDNVYRPTRLLSVREPYAS